EKTAIVAARTAARESPKQSIRASTAPLRFATRPAESCGGLLVGSETVSRWRVWVAVVLSICGFGGLGQESVGCTGKYFGISSAQPENSDKRTKSPSAKHFGNECSPMRSAADLAFGRARRFQRTNIRLPRPDIVTATHRLRDRAHDFGGHNS